MSTNNILIKIASRILQDQFFDIKTAIQIVEISSDNIALSNKKL